MATLNGSVGADTDPTVVAYGTPAIDVERSLRIAALDASNERRSGPTGVASEGAESTLVTYEYSTYRYRGSLQLFASENIGTSRSFPHIFLPAGLGSRWKCSFLSPKYLSIAAIASSIDL